METVDTTPFRLLVSFWIAELPVVLTPPSQTPTTMPFRRYTFPLPPTTDGHSTPNLNPTIRKDVNHNEPYGTVGVPAFR